MKTPFLVVALFLVPNLLLSDEEREIPLPHVALTQPPLRLPQLNHSAPSDDQITEIEQAIANLASVTSKSSAILYDHPFEAVVCLLQPAGNDRSDWEKAADDEIEAPVRKLIEAGPAAIPFLLDNLDSPLPTEIVVTAVKTEAGIAGGMAFDEILHGNPANFVEAGILRLSAYGFSPSIHGRRVDAVVPPQMESYRVKVGDVCLGILGQITGRGYYLFSSPHVKSSGLLVNSPVARPALLKRVKRIWTTKSPRQRLFESLVLDFSTRGIQSGEYLDGWDDGHYIQIQALLRLQKHFPQESANFIAERIAGFDLQSLDYVEQCSRNGIRVEEFVKAVQFQNGDEIHTALRKLASVATEPSIVSALSKKGLR